MKTTQPKKIKDKKNNMVLASFMLFVFPILAVFIGVFLGQYIGYLLVVPIRISQIFGGIVGFVIAIFLIKLFDRSAIVDDKEEKIDWDDL